MEIPKEVLEQLEKKQFCEAQVKSETNEEKVSLVEENEKISGFDKAPKYEIVSKMAYLLGLDRERYVNNNYSIEIFEELEKNRMAKIIRNLCILRNLSLIHSKKVYNIIKDEHKAIFAINDVYPSEVFAYLISESIKFSEKTNYVIEVFEMEINKHIQDRIGTITKLFSWIDYSYIRELFLMPNGTDYNCLRKEVEKYYQNQELYPFSLYINWEPRKTGNILKNDMTFCWTLYDMHGKKFKDVSKVTDISNTKKRTFYDFVDNYKKILLVVDCENTDVYRLIAAFKGLREEYLLKIYKIMLVDDPHTTEVWKRLSNYIDIPIEYEEVERVLNNKSLVDGTIMMNVQREYDRESIDAVIVASSDSDFWVIKKKIKDIGLFVMTQFTQSSQEYLEILTNNGIGFCHIDDFDSTNSDFIIKDAFKYALKQYMNERILINVNKLISDILFNIHAELNEQEKKNYIDRYIKNLKIEIDEGNNLKVNL